MTTVVARSAAEEFNGKYIPEPNSGCWLWDHAFTNGGYGVLSGRRHGQRGIRAHRFSWQMHRGPIPRGLHVLHKCDTPACVNPDHLFIGSHADNMKDMTRKGRAHGGAPSGERHGRALLTKENVSAIRASSSSCRELASVYGVSKSTVDYAKRGVTWK